MKVKQGLGRMHGSGAWSLVPGCCCRACACSLPDGPLARICVCREFQTPDEEMKKIVLKVVKQCVGTDGVEPDYIRQEVS